MLESMKRVRLAGFSLLLCAAMFSACDDDDDNGNDLNATDKDFVQKATFGNRAEIELGELAEDRGSEEAVVMFGSMMVADHQLALDELQDIADDNDVDTPEGLDQEHQNIKALLQTLDGYEFDSAYMKSQVMDHEKTIQLFKTQINSGKDQGLKNYASKYLPKIEMHHHHADSIFNALVEADETDFE